MAASQRLPNGHIVLILTPREATSLSDELLQPEGYPWQTSENQITAMEVRSQLRGLVMEDAMGRLEESSRTLLALQAEQEERERLEAEES